MNNVVRRILSTNPRTCIIYGEDIGHQTLYNSPFLQSGKPSARLLKDHATPPLTLTPTGRVCSRGKLTVLYGPYDNAR